MLSELWLINGLIALLFAGGGMAIKNLYSRLQDMDHRLSNLHLIYAKREDVANAFEAIRLLCQRIEDKLDKKVDR